MSSEMLRRNSTTKRHRVEYKVNTMPSDQQVQYTSEKTSNLSGDWQSALTSLI